MSDRNDPDEIIRDATAIATTAVGLAGLVFMNSKAKALAKEEDKLRGRLNNQLKQSNITTYFGHVIVGVSCPECNAKNEEGQWYCYMCGASM